MRVLVDTTVWSLVLRRNRARRQHEQVLQHEMQDLITTGRAAIVGPVRQELLSGIREARTFELLNDRLQDFPDEPLVTDDFVEAARCSNVCRAAGVSGSATDFLLCAAALRRDWAIFTTDGDFARYAMQLRFRLYNGLPHEPM